MANQAKFYVKNESTKGFINVPHYLPDGTLAPGTPKKISNDGRQHLFELNSTDDYLIIESPKKENEPKPDSRYVSIRLRADTDIDLKYLRTNHTWKIQIIPNSLPPIAPTKVNVTVGDENPTP